MAQAIVDFSVRGLPVGLIEQQWQFPKGPGDKTKHVSCGAFKRVSFAYRMDVIDGIGEEKVGVNKVARGAASGNGLPNLSQRSLELSTSPPAVSSPSFTRKRSEPTSLLLSALLPLDTRESLKDSEKRDLETTPEGKRHENRTIHGWPIAWRFGMRRRLGKMSVVGIKGPRSVQDLHRISRRLLGPPIP